MNTDEAREALVREAQSRIAHVFEGEGEAWWSDTSGDHLAQVAADAIAHMLVGPDPEAIEDLATQTETYIDFVERRAVFDAPDRKEARDRRLNLTDAVALVRGT